VENIKNDSQQKKIFPKNGQNKGWEKSFISQIPPPPSPKTKQPGCLVDPSTPSSVEVTNG